MVSNHAPQELLDTVLDEGEVYILIYQDNKIMLSTTKMRLCSVSVLHSDVKEKEAVCFRLLSKYYH